MHSELCRNLLFKDWIFLILNNFLKTELLQIINHQIIRYSVSNDNPQEPVENLLNLYFEERNCYASFHILFLNNFFCLINNHFI
jgi:hypothetical protein